MKLPAPAIKVATTDKDSIEFKMPSDIFSRNLQMHENVKIAIDGNPFVPVVKWSNML